MEDKNKLYVGNLPYTVDDAALEALFKEVEGVTVVEAKVITDKFNTGRSKGFGFVTVESEEMANKAIEAMNGKEIEGRPLTVSVARPQEKRSDRGGNFDRSYR
ncbi:MAG: RNA-binding protein [Candidatus Berkelbacteria bacterium]|nr:RNA-binding protein [Candidatus Berkelbacteria bacterium]